MKLLQRKNGLKSISCFNITPRDIANIIGCLHDNKELTIWTITDQSEVHLTAYH